MDATTQFEDIAHSPKADEYMKDLYIGDFEPPEYEDANKAGILDNEKNGGGDDLMSRALLAIFVIAVIYYLFT